MKRLIETILTMLGVWWRPPKRLSQFRAEVIDMSNVRLSWNTPQPSSRQRPVAVVRLASRVAEDMPWTTIANVPHPQSEVVLPDVAPGVWYYQAIVVDIDEEESDPAYASTALAYDKPSALMGFSAAIEG